jgi:CRISPR type I-E-associated protein CasB/Cse2
MTTTTGGRDQSPAFEPHREPVPAADGAARTTPRPEYQLMAVVEARLTANRTDPSRPHAGWLAAVRNGLVTATEVQALPATATFTSGLTGAHQQKGARKAAAIRTINKKTRSFTATDDHRYQPLGVSLRVLYKADRGRYPDDASADALTMQINALPLMDLESATTVLNQMVGRCAGQGVTVDFYDLARTLIWWGNGISPASRRTRNNVVAAFYGARIS